MAAQTALVLNTKSYAPRGKNSGNVAAWALVGDTTFGGATSIVSLRVSEPDKNGNTRVSARLTVPKAATADSACACVGQNIGVNYFDATVTVSSSDTAAERTDLRTRIKDFFASAVFTAAIDNLEGAW